MEDEISPITIPPIPITANDSSDRADSVLSLNRRKFLKALGIAAGAMTIGGISMMKSASAVAPAPIPAPTLAPTAIPKYVNQLVIPPVFTPGTAVPGVDSYAIDVASFVQQILPPPLPMTPVWGYGGLTSAGFVRHYPAATFEAVRGKPVQVLWSNGLTVPHLFAVDPTLHWANPNMIPMNLQPPFPAYPPGFNGTIIPGNPDGFNAQSPVPIITHLHGGETQSQFDGHPDAWFTNGNAITGQEFTPGPFTYLNTQQAATLWYHDHALGITRLNVMAGLAGFYLLRDPADTIAPKLPGGKYEIPLAIQDRSFNLDGTLFFPQVGLNPTIHPYWMPEFFGNTIVVNGSAWPNLNVDRTMYRFRLLNGSNARFYTLNFSNKMAFTQIGTDGGYLQAPVTLTSLTIAPGERADILVDFSAIAPGTTIILENTAKAPFPRGAPPNPQTVGQIMQFTVPLNAPVVPPVATLAQIIAGWSNPTLPAGAFPTLPAASTTRILTLNEVMGPAGPIEILLNGQKWAAAISELPKNGTTEDWAIVNTTADTHPIHLHLVQFQLVSRQPFQTKKYLTDWLLANLAGLGPGGMLPLTQPTVVLPFAPYLQGKPVPPDLNEMGWKDTVRMNPGEVTIIRVRFTAQDGTPFPFDPTTGPGYVWHCHIIDHEDNEMMRPYKVIP